MAGAAGGGVLELGWVPSGGCADEEEDAEGCMATGGGGTAAGVELGFSVWLRGSGDGDLGSGDWGGGGIAELVRR
jgi:hypothetical protein